MSAELARFEDDIVAKIGQRQKGSPVVALTRMFRHYDVEDTGVVTFSGFRRALEGLTTNVVPHMLQKVFDRYAHGAETLNYREFAALFVSGELRATDQQKVFFPDPRTHYDVSVGGLPTGRDVRVSARPAGNSGKSVFERFRLALRSLPEDFLFTLANEFRTCDVGNHRRVSVDAFVHVLTEVVPMGSLANLTATEALALAGYFAASGADSVNYDAFLESLSVPLKGVRLATVGRLFQRLDEDKDGITSVGDVMSLLQAERHPTVTRQEATVDEVRGAFMSALVTTIVYMRESRDVRTRGRVADVEALRLQRDVSFRKMYNGSNKSKQSGTVGQTSAWAPVAGGSTVREAQTAVFPFGVSFGDNRSDAEWDMLSQEPLSWEDILSFFSFLGAGVDDDVFATSVEILFGLDRPFVSREKVFSPARVNPALLPVAGEETRQRVDLHTRRNGSAGLPRSPEFRKHNEAVDLKSAFDKIRLNCSRVKPSPIQALARVVAAIVCADADCDGMLEIEDVRFVKEQTGNLFLLTEDEEAGLFQKLGKTVVNQQGVTSTRRSSPRRQSLKEHRLEPNTRVQIPVNGLIAMLLGDFDDATTDMLLNDVWADKLTSQYGEWMKERHEEGVNVRGMIENCFRSQLHPFVFNDKVSEPFMVQDLLTVGHILATAGMHISSQLFANETSPVRKNEFLHLPVHVPQRDKIMINQRGFIWFNLVLATSLNTPNVPVAMSARQFAYASKPDSPSFVYTTCRNVFERLWGLRDVEVAEGAMRATPAASHARVETGGATPAELESMQRGERDLFGRSKRESPVGRGRQNVSVYSTAVANPHEATVLAKQEAMKQTVKQSAERALVLADAVSRRSLDGHGRFRRFWLNDPVAFVQNCVTTRQVQLEGKHFNNLDLPMDNALMGVSEMIVAILAKARGALAKQVSLSAWMQLLQVANRLSVVASSASFPQLTNAAGNSLKSQMDDLDRRHRMMNGHSRMEDVEEEKRREEYKLETLFKAEEHLLFYRYVLGKADYQRFRRSANLTLTDSEADELFRFFSKRTGYAMLPVAALVVAIQGELKGHRASLASQAWIVLTSQFENGETSEQVLEDDLLLSGVHGEKHPFVLMGSMTVDACRQQTKELFALLRQIRKLPSEQSKVVTKDMYVDWVLLNSAVLAADDLFEQFIFEAVGVPDLENASPMHYNRPRTSLYTVKSSEGTAFHQPQIVKDQNNNINSNYENIGKASITSHQTRLPMDARLQDPQEQLTNPRSVAAKRVFVRNPLVPALPLNASEVVGVSAMDLAYEAARNEHRPDAKIGWESAEATDTLKHHQTQPYANSARGTARMPAGATKDSLYRGINNHNQNHSGSVYHDNQSNTTVDELKKNLNQHQQQQHQQHQQHDQYNPAPSYTVGQSTYSPPRKSVAFSGRLSQPQAYATARPNPAMDAAGVYQPSAPSQPNPSFFLGGSSERQPGQSRPTAYAPPPRAAPQQTHKYSDFF